MELSEHLFRHEYGRLVVALTRLFGLHNLPLAEDVVQDAFCRALEVWKVRGIPDNPSAWLMAAAKNRALDVVRRERTATMFAPDLARALVSEWTLAPAVAEAFDQPVIEDEQLRMMFTCCHPRLGVDTQVALVLNILCGFSAGEVASAYLTGRAAMEKRIARGKQTLARSKHVFSWDDKAFGVRLSSVLRALYLLFSEGYHGGSAETSVRAELCGEAIRLVTLLLELRRAQQPETYALAALMSLHAARLPARVNDAGELSGWFDQDRTRWDRPLIERGLQLLDRSAVGPTATSYHLEAAIAAAHVTADRAEDTDWGIIVGLYDRLMAVAGSPVVALNRAIAIGQRDGAARGLEAITAIDHLDRLARYPFYPAAVGELEFRRGNPDAARASFASAASLARNPLERRFLERRARECAVTPGG